MQNKGYTDPVWQHSDTQTSPGSWLLQTLSLEAPANTPDGSNWKGHCLAGHQIKPLLTMTLHPKREAGSLTNALQSEGWGDGDMALAHSLQGSSQDEVPGGPMLVCKY